MITANKQDITFYYEQSKRGCKCDGVAHWECMFLNPGVPWHTIVNIGDDWGVKWNSLKQGANISYLGVYNGKYNKVFGAFFGKFQVIAKRKEK